MVPASIAAGGWGVNSPHVGALACLLNICSQSLELWT